MARAPQGTGPAPCSGMPCGGSRKRPAEWREDDDCADPDLRRALKKPVEQRRWVMVINTKRCTGCYACVVACMAENGSPPGVAYRRVGEVESGEYPQVARTFMPTNCMHCENPPCMKAAPAGAITKRPD